MVTGRGFGCGDAMRAIPACCRCLNKLCFLKMTEQVKTRRSQRKVTGKQERLTVGANHKSLPVAKGVNSLMLVLANQMDRNICRVVLYVRKILAMT
jgi:hypothetical protein